MGFWGTYLVTRSTCSMMTLDALRTSTEDLMWQGFGDDDWQAVRFHRGPVGWEVAMPPADWERVLVSVMEQTGRPVLAGAVYDSDGAQLVGYSPRAGRWGGWLSLERIIGHLDSDAWPYAYEDENGEWQTDEGEEYQRRVEQVANRLYEVNPPASGAAPLAVRWAAEAGLSPAVSAVEAVLGDGEIFVEDLFMRFLDVLGVPALTER